MLILLHTESSVPFVMLSAVSKCFLSILISWNSNVLQTFHVFWERVFAIFDRQFQAYVEFRDMSGKMFFKLQTTNSKNLKSQFQCLKVILCFFSFFNMLFDWGSQVKMVDNDINTWLLNQRCCTWVLTNKKWMRNLHNQVSLTS